MKMQLPLKDKTSCPGSRAGARLAALTPAAHQPGTRNGARSSLVMDREVEEGHFLISQLGFGVETRIKSLLLGRVPRVSAFYARCFLAVCPASCGAQASIPGLLWGHGWQVPSAVSNSQGLKPGWKPWAVFYPSCIPVVESSPPPRVRCRQGAVADVEAALKTPGGGMGALCAASSTTFYSRHQCSS